MPRLAIPSRYCLLVALLALLGGVRGGVADEPRPDAKEVEFFEAKIRPVLVERCYRCHSAEAHAKNQLKGSLLVDSREGLLKGGDSGVAIKPGHADESLLIESLRYESFEMPPDGQLSDDVIADFVAWIERGAVDPRQADVIQPQRTIDIAAGREHWAYHPIPKLSQIAELERDGETISPVDAFIGARLDEAGLEPMPPADRTTLLRRVTFDLIGLPPTPEEMERFLADDSADAYERLVDRLLASPHFGERWGRHWLDIVRFAESVTLRGLVQQQAWRYRDYVINAFNEDMSYYEFLRQQVAGDLLDADSLEERRRQLIATTFLTLTNANLEDQDKEKLRMDVVDEQLTVIGKAFLGQTIGCARCHDHKFDPIPTTDYYALAGILRNTKTMEHANVSRWVEQPLPVSSQQQQRIEQHAAAVAAIQKELARLTPKGAKSKGAKSVPSNSLAGIVVDDERAEFQGEWTRSTSIATYVDDGYQHDGNNNRGQKSATYSAVIPKTGRYEVRMSYTAEANRSSVVHVSITDSQDMHEVTVNQRKKPPIDGLWESLGEYDFHKDARATVVILNTQANGHVIADAVAFLPVDDRNVVKQDASTDEPSLSSDEIKQQQARIKQLQAELKHLEQSAPSQPLYQAVVEETDIADGHVNVRGNVHQLGEAVPRGFLQVATAGPAPKLPADESGRRQLGDWLAERDNPLPSRVMVNRIWHWLFGEGLVGTPDNFGTTGETPTHPELLDYLAARLIDTDGSCKSVIREIVLSDAYRRSSEQSDRAMSLDPANELLWRMNHKRLDAECMVDAVLRISGQLDETLGGKTLPGDLAADYDYEHDSHRRAVYWPVLRNSLPELTLVFDGADPSLVTGRRNVSSVAPQALYLMNNPWVAEQAELTASRLLDGAADDDNARIERMFALIVGRAPTDAERRAVSQFLSRDDETSDADRHARWTQVVHSLLCTLDFRYLH